MTFSLIRTFCAGNSYANLCSKCQHRTGFPRKLDLPFNSINTLKSNLNHARQYRRLQENPDVIHVGLNSLVKPFFFTIGVSGFSIAGATIWHDENRRASSKWFYNHTPKYGEYRRRLNEWWHSLRTGDKVFVPICFINVLVFAAWKVPALQPVMSRYFLSGLASKAVCWPMLFSVFSHYNILHLGANMFVLRSFCEPAVNALGKEQFVGMYLSAGVISSFTSHFYKAVIGSRIMSLGASGAVMCVLGYVCSRNPDSQLSIILLPQLTFDAATGLKCIIGFDLLGCIMRWGIMDHAAHLGGSLFGVFWFHFGQRFIWNKRQPLIDAWHKLRGVAN